MKLSQFGLLTDENIDPDVADWLAAAGFDVLDVKRANLQGTDDVDLMRRAVAENRIVVTHDADFGTLVMLQGEPVVGLCSSGRATSTLNLRLAHSRPCSQPIPI